MQQVKIFKEVETELEPMEQRINRWLKKEKDRVRILSITGNIAPQTPSSSGMTSSFSAADVLVIILFEIVE
ncbi:MAG: hypothetical protein AAFP90_13810 [Planctomycetota bacterium]